MRSLTAAYSVRLGGSMKGWTWQKWVGKLAPIVSGLLATGVWEFAELPAPVWAGVAASLLTMLIQGIISLFPAKT